MGGSARQSISMWQALTAGLGLLTLAGGAWAEAQPPSPDATAERPRIGLALGGGGARGGAHVGVLKVLDELRVPVDCVAGTSMGALVGATFAAGATAEAIERELGAINWAATIGTEGQRALVPMQRKLAGVTYSNSIEFAVSGGRLHGDGGFLPSQHVEERLRLLIGQAREVVDFDALPLPFRAVATDLRAGEMVVLSSGNLAQAMRASMAVPGMFAPVVVGDRVLADGGMMRNLPVDVARELCADVVIAVLLEAPPPEAQDLRSLFSVAGRSIDAMVQANERQQLATLGERDVPIIVPVGDIRSSEFDRVLEAIPLGEAAALKMAGALRRYALPEDEYRRWRAGVQPPDVAPVRIDEIRFRPMRHTSPDYLWTRMRTSLGDTVTPMALERDLSRIFSSGDFARVDYRLRPGPGDKDGATLEIAAVEREGGTDFLRFDLGVAGSSGGDTLFLLRADHRREWLNALGGQWRNALQLGQLSELETALYQPVDVAQRRYVEATLHVSRSLEDVYDDGDRVARYDFIEAQARLGGGLNIGDHARIHGGLHFGTSDIQLDTGVTPVFDTQTRRDNAVVLGGIYDTRDSARLPVDGLFAQLEYTYSGSWAGGEQSYELVEAVAGRALQVGDHVIMVSGGIGDTLSGTLPRYRDFSVGGVRSFPALKRGELRGEGYWSASAVWMLKVADIQALFGHAAYAGIGLHALRVTERIDRETDRTLVGASATLGARTPFGPLLFSIGAADNGRVQLHIALGRPIPEGSLLDRLH